MLADLDIVRNLEPFARRDGLPGGALNGLLREHGIGSCRDRRAGKDPRNTALGQHARWISGETTSAQGAGLTGIRRAQGVAVHGAVIPGRDIACGELVYSENPAQSRPQRQHLYAGKRLDLFKQRLQRVFQGMQRQLAHGSAARVTEPARSLSRARSRG